jgi:hypothetical protein
LDSDSISIQTCFLNLFLEFTRTTYLGNLYLSAYPNLARTAYLNFIRAPYPSLSRSHQCLPGLIRSYLAELPYPILLPIELLLTRPYTVLPGRITLLDLFSIGLLPTQSYPATVPDILTRPGNTSLHPTAYPALPNHLARPGTLHLASPEKFLIGLPPRLMLNLADNALR